MFPTASHGPAARRAARNPENRGCPAKPPLAARCSRAINTSNQSPTRRYVSRNGASLSPSMNISPLHLWVCPSSALYRMAGIPSISIPSIYSSQSHRRSRRIRRPAPHSLSLQTVAVRCHLLPYSPDREQVTDQLPSPGGTVYAPKRHGVYTGRCGHRPCRPAIQSDRAAKQHGRWR